MHVFISSFVEKFDFMAAFGQNRYGDNSPDSRICICTVKALTAFKEAIYEDPHLVLSQWNTLDSDPCDWFGVSCSPARDHVIKL